MFSLRRILTPFLLACAISSAPVFGQSFSRSTTTFPAVGLFVPTASVAFGNGVFVGLGLNGRPAAASSNSISAYTSTDGSVWTERVINIPNVSLNNHGVVRFIGGEFIFTGRTLTQSYVARSADGVSWTVANPENLSPLNGFAEIVAGGGVGVGFFGTVLSSSTDGGATWTARTAAGVASTAPYYDLAYGAGRFVLTATGTATKVWTSPDAATWTEILAGQQSSGRIAYGNGTFVLTGTNYKTSTDGVNFTVRPTPTGFNLTGTNLLRFLGGRFIYQSFGFNSSFQLVPNLMGSPDGLTWTQMASYDTTLSSMTVLDFAEGNNRLIAVGSVSGGTLFSPTHTATVAVLDTTNLPALPSAGGPPSITTQPQSASVAANGNTILSVAATGTGLTYQWNRNGTAVSGATSATLALNNLQPANTGLYYAAVTGTATTTSAAAIVGLSTTAKVVGAGTEILTNQFVAFNNNTFDQVGLQGTAATITADASQITRISFVDMSDDIVQVEFSGAGSLSLVLDSATGPAAPVKYNQSGVTYYKGHVGIVIVGADESTNVSVFSVGSLTAANQALFKSDVTYDGLADLAFIAISTTNGKFGGVRTSNASYFATKGFTGIYAPGVAFSGPVFVGDLNAFDAATPVLVIGSSPDTRVTGGDLLQTNGQAITATGLTQLKMTAGITSHSGNLPAQTNKAVIRQNGVDVTAQVIVNP